MDLGIIDWVFIVIVVAGLLVGFKWGLINVLSSLGGLIIGFVVARFLADGAQNLVGDWFDNPQAAWVICYFVIAFVISTLIWVAGGIFHFFVARLHLKIVDRVIGAAVGFALALIATFIIAAQLHNQQSPKMQQALQSSKLVPKYFAVFDKFEEWLGTEKSESIKSNVKETWDKVHSKNQTHIGPPP